MRIENINNAYINGKKVTIFDVYELDGKDYVYSGQQSIKGHYKRESTILRKMNEELS